METKTKTLIQNLLEKNRRVKNEFQYTIPSPDTYPNQWLWDSCFHSIILSHFDIDSAKKEIFSLISKQFENGMIPHMIYWERNGKIDFDWGKETTSSITQPPMLAYAIWNIFEKDRDIEFLQKTYRSLFHFYKYLINDRDPHARNLIGILNPDESGEDNSPRFDSCLDLPPKHKFDENLNKRLLLIKENKQCNFDAPFCMKDFFWVKDVPFNAIMIKNLNTLANIAEKIGESYDAEYFKKKADDISKAMKEMMFEDGMFWSTFGEDYKKIKIKTWAIFSPMFAKIVSQDEASELVEKHLKNEKEFWSTHSISTVSKDEPSYDPNCMWRGPVWIGVNWFLYHSLKNYGFNEIAENIKNSSIKLIEEKGFREYYNPETGEGLGAHDFTWGGLTIDMI